MIDLLTSGAWMLLAKFVCLLIGCSFPATAQVVEGSEALSEIDAVHIQAVPEFQL